MAPIKKHIEYSPVTSLDLITGSFPCDRCGAIVEKFFYTENVLCIDCVLVLDPPKMTLTLSASSSYTTAGSIEPLCNYDLWNNTSLRQEHTMFIKDFITCGWFIRKVEETSQIVPKRVIREVDLEYYGNLLCFRAKDHYDSLGLGDLDKCRSPFCEFLVMRYEL